MIPEYKQNPEVKQHSVNESVYKNAWERTELLLQARVKRPRGQVSLFVGSYEQHRAKVQATLEIERTRPISEKFTSLQIWQAQLRIPSKRLLKNRIQGLQQEHSVTNQPSSRNLYTKSDIHLTEQLHSRNPKESNLKYLLQEKRYLIISQQIKGRRKENANSLIAVRRV